MAESWQQLLDRFKERWNEMPAPRRKVLALSAAVSLLIAGVILFYATRPRYSPLFSQLSPEDAGIIVDKLKEDKVPYRVTGKGDTIEVPQTALYEEKMKMATAGLPQSSGPGWELFDHTSLGMTEFTQKLNYQRALQGELSRTIMQLAKVQNARVHLTIPEPSLYSEDQKDPTASVMLSLRGSQPLQKEEVQGIVHLVSHAVEGMKPENVTIVDGHGTILSSDANETDFSPEQAEANFQMQDRVEKQAQRDVQSMLDKALGPGKAVVRVRARLDYNRREVNSESYGSDDKQGKGVLQEQHAVEESYNGRDNSGGGLPPGVASNSDTGLSGLSAYRTSTGTPGKYSRRETTSRYQVSKRVEHIVNNPGDVARMSVAILINGNLSAAERDSLAQAAAAAAGLDTSRGDQISVVSMPFDTTAEQADKKQQQEEMRRDLIATGLRYGLAILLMLFVFLIVRQALRRPTPRALEEKTPTMAALEDAPTVGQMLDEMEQSPATPESVSKPDAEPEPEPELEALPITPPSVERLQRLAKDKPEMVAALLRSWLADQK